MNEKYERYQAQLYNNETREVVSIFDNPFLTPILLVEQVEVIRYTVMFIRLLILTLAAL